LDRPTGAGRALPAGRGKHCEEQSTKRILQKILSNGFSASLPDPPMIRFGHPPILAGLPNGKEEPE
jgi:hypothetical protein